MPKVSFKIGHLYWIKFLDHFIGSEDEITCECCGWIAHSGKTWVKVVYWKTNSAAGDEALESSNNETMKLIRSTIIAAQEIVIIG